MSDRTDTDTATLDAPVGQSRELQGEATRARLLAVAVAALEHGGEQNIKVRDMANALGVSIGAVYHHFENREGLIVAARIAQFDGLLAADVEAVRDLIDRAHTVDDLRRGMRFLTRAAHSDARARFRRIRAEVAGVALHNAELSEALAEAQDRCTTSITEIVELAQRKGLANPDLDPRAVATFLQSVSLGLVLNDINTVHPMDQEAWFAFTDRFYETLLATS